MQCAHLLTCVLISFQYCHIMAIPHGDMIPVSSPSKVTFMLYTRANAKQPETMRMFEEGQEYKITPEISKTTFDKLLKTVVIIHGYSNNYDSRVNTLLREAYLQSNNFNIFVVDWSQYSMDLYSVAVEHTNTVSLEIACFIENLVNSGTFYSKIGLVGYSLGAHIAGGVGRNLNSKISYIIGLDPTGLFWGENLRATDAQFVQVIHTNDGIFGMDASIGTVDFFPNGGRVQPNCHDFGTCSHSRVYELFEESLIGPTKFVSVSCGSFEEFQNGNCSGKNTSYFGGASIDVMARGNYFLYTNGKSPFAIKSSNINYTTTGVA